MRKLWTIICKIISPNESLICNNYRAGKSKEMKFWLSGSFEKHFIKFINSLCIFQISLVSDKTSGKPRGYAFIEFEHERDMHCK